jgi:Mor family transcriptional regulator
MISEKRNKIFDSSYVVKENGCWEWTKYIDHGGYPKTSFRKSKNLSSRISAHRYSYERFKGEIPVGLYVCHNCPGGDNRSCVNPNHLWLGTQLENMQDKGNKGNQCKGVTHGNHKLTEQDVKDIRRRYSEGEYGSDLAKEYNVSNGLIYHIKNGKAWKYTIIGDECEKLKKIKRNYPIKLTEEDVRNIRRRYSEGEKVIDLAKEFDVESTMISRIKNGKAWKHIL